jgi:integration host factor subunit beta
MAFVGPSQVNSTSSKWIRLLKSMTKSELIEILASRHNQLAPKDAELAVKTMLDAMSVTLAQGDRIEIRGFGSFGLNFRPPRTGRNPKTGEKVLVPKKYVPHFKAGKELRERVDEALEAAEAAMRAETSIASPTGGVIARNGSADD